MLNIAIEINYCYNISDQAYYSINITDFDLCLNSAVILL